jgi:hypothetical protein
MRSLIAKEIGKGFLQAIGGAAATALGATLLLYWPSFRTWVTHLVGEHALSRISVLTTVLIVSNLVLLGLWIASQIRFFWLRERIRQDSLTLGDTMSSKDMMKAMDIEGAIRQKKI